MLLEKLEKVKNFLFARQHAYQMIFAKESLLAQKVLVDLAKFCRANETTFHSDPRAHAVLEGRREVWLRIQRHLNLSSEDLWNFHNRKDLSNE